MYWRKRWSDPVGTTLTAVPLRAAFVAASLSSLLLVPGCKKPENELGLSVLDPADTLSTVRLDTSAVVAWPRVDNAVRTSSLSANEIGSYLDDRFGNVLTGTAMQVRLSANNVGPADPSLICDSLVLNLAYSATNPVYGDLDPQIIRVFRLTEDLFIDSIYKSNRQPAFGNGDMVQGSPRSFTPPASTDTAGSRLRIPLSTDLGNELLQLWGQSTLADNASFLAFFKGLVVMPDSTPQAPFHGGVWRMNLLDGTSKMTLYYHNGAGVNSAFDFIIGTGSARYTFSWFNRALAPDPVVATALADTVHGPRTATYVQALGGVRTEVRFPWLDRYAATPLRAVAKAELVVPIAGEFHATYVPPDQLFAFRKAADGTDLLVPDQIAGQGLVGGLYDGGAKEYRLNLTRWVQGVISGTYPNTGLSLVPGSDGVSVNRAELGGPANGQTPMKMVITFTTY